MSSSQISRTAIITLNDSADKILPLFTAYGETLWISGWNPEYVYPEDGEARANAVWKTQHDESGPETIWVTIHYDTETHSVTYISFRLDHHVARVDIQCDAIAGGKTSAQITYTITALGEKGIHHIEQLTQEHYDRWMKSWEMAINHYLQHGEAAAH